MNWSIVFFFLFLFSLVVLVIGTKDPKIIFPNKDISRVRFFLGSLLVSFLLLSFSIAISPSSEKSTSLPSPTPELVSSTPTSFQPTETPAPEVQSAQTESTPGPSNTPSPTLTLTPTLKISTPTPKPPTPTRVPPTPTPVTYYSPPTQSPSSGGTGGSWACNCSKTCPNMSSCAEAQYQLNVCGCTARDADHDGIACDSDCQ